MRTLESFSNDEKIKVFDHLYNHAKSIVDEAIEIEYLSDDAEHYLYEDVMMSFLGNDIWDTLNKYAY